MSGQNPGPRKGGDMKETERIVRPQGGPGPMGQAGMVGQKAHDFGFNAKRVVRRMAPYRFRAIGVLALAVGAVALTTLGPKLLGRATDIIFGGAISVNFHAGTTQAQAAAEAAQHSGSKFGQMVAGLRDFHAGFGIDFHKLGVALMIVITVYVIGSIFSWLQGFVLNDVVQGTIRDLRSDVESKVHRLPLEYFDRQPRGELLSRVTNDIDNLGQSLQQTLSQLLSSILTVVAVIAMMFWISWQLALIALLTVPIAMFVTRTVMRRSQGQFVSQWRRTGVLNAHIEETYTGHDLVRTFGRQDEAHAVFAERNESLYQASFKAQFISGLIMPLMMFVGNINFVAIAVVGGLKVANGQMSLGDIQAFIQYSRQFTQPLTQVASMMNLLQSGVASAERVFELLDAPEQVPDVDGTAAGCTQGEVRFEHVAFAYDPEKPLIQDLSLVAAPGQTVAIVGPTGAGKTTLVNLIMRFYELHGGRITLDGVDVASIPRAELRSRIGMVLQDTWLFEGTIRDNIAYGNPNATEDDIIAAAKATFVDRFVRSLPDGYDTVIDGEGGSLSAGERQLITIARAFVAQPSLLILDEATSSVDTRTELLVQHAMAALRSDRTSFVIAHRLSTIRDADLILVMESGAIVEQGTHDSLLASGGAYARLYKSQFAAEEVA